MHISTLKKIWVDRRTDRLSNQKVTQRHNHEPGKSQTLNVRREVDGDRRTRGEAILRRRHPHSDLS